jgi:hypothetical protein
MELEMDPTESTNPISNQLVYDLEDRGRSQTMSVSRSVKLMSELIKNQSTPKNIRGVEIDERQKQKFSNKKEKILGLEIEIDLPEYDADG